MTDAVQDAEQAESPFEWLELFFDLVVVAAVALLTDGLLEHADGHGLGLFLLTYTAIWLSWVTVVLYANVAGGSTHTQTVLLSMVLVGVMAASDPWEHPGRADAFAWAFIVLRLFASRSSLRTGRLLTSWPLLQLGGVTAVWVASMWLPVPTKYWVWGAALVADLAFAIARGDDDPDSIVSRFNARMQKGRRHRQADDGRSPQTYTAVEVNVEHLDERLGLFLIIVLGEAVTQLVVAAAHLEWDRSFVAPTLLAFLVLVGLWWLTFSYGFTAAPHTRLAELPPRFALPTHLLTTIGIVALAGGLGEMVSHPDERIEGLLRWVMCGGMALHFLVTGLGGLAAGAPLRWLLGWALPCTALPLAVGLLGGVLSNVATVLILGVAVWWMIAYAQRSRGLDLLASRRSAA